MVLTPARVRAYYDRFGRRQDSQAFYEDRAVDDLIAHADLASARRVFEFGCGTGRLAARLLAGPLPAAATYIGCDLSETMVRLAGRRLAGHAGRAHVLRTGGGVRFPLADGAVDRVISTYVIDLLSEEDIAGFLSEARRVLAPGGRLCLASLTWGTSFPSRMVSALWARIFRLRPAWVGGCRPVRLSEHLDPVPWRVEHRKVVAAFGVPSEVLVAEARAGI